VDKKVYTNDEIMDILTDHFSGDFVVTGTIAGVEDDGSFYSKATFLGHIGNTASCYGLAMQAAKELDRKCNSLPWDSEED
jgi:hypothetical protein